MKTEETLAPEQQPVTWGNRVATVLMIGVVWLVLYLYSSSIERSTASTLFEVALIVGTYPTTLGFVIALFAKHRQQQRWYRCFAWWAIFPGILVGGVLSVLIRQIFSMREEPEWAFVLGQTLLFICAHLVYSRKQNRKLKNGNIVTSE